MTPYEFNSSDWLKLQHSDWRANLVKDFFFTNEFSTNESNLIYKGSHDLTGLTFILQMITANVSICKFIFDSSILSGSFTLEYEFNIAVAENI